MIHPHPPILPVVARYVALRRHGREWFGLCPFHAEKNPSFSVNEDRGFYYCHGCHAGGDVYSFLMQVAGMTFLEARRALGVDGDYSSPKLTPKRLRAAEEAAAWADRQRERLNALITDRLEQRDLADEIGDSELGEIFEREIVLLRAFYNSLSAPSGIIELLPVRQALEAITP